MSYSNPYLRDFLPVFDQILKAKEISPETLYLEVLDEEDREMGLFETAGVVDVLEQIAGELNFLTVYTDRLEHFEKFAKDCYMQNGLMTVFYPKKALGRKNKRGER